MTTLFSCIIRIFVDIVAADDGKMARFRHIRSGRSYERLWHLKDIIDARGRFLPSIASAQNGVEPYLAHTLRQVERDQSLP